MKVCLPGTHKSARLSAMLCPILESVAGWRLQLTCFKVEKVVRIACPSTGHDLAKPHRRVFGLGTEQSFRSLHAHVSCPRNGAGRAPRGPVSKNGKTSQKRSICSRKLQLFSGVVPRDAGASVPTEDRSRPMQCDPSNASQNEDTAI